MVKKIMGLLLLMVMMMSMVPVAFAQTDSTADDNIVDDESDVLTSIKNEKTRIKLIDGELFKVKRTKEISKIGVDFQKKKISAKDKVKEFKKDLERLQNLKENHKEKKEKYLIKSKDAKRLHKELRECRSTQEDCSDLFHKRNNIIRQQILSASEYITSALDKLENRVEASETLDEDEKDFLFEEIATDRLAIENAVNNLKGLSEDEDVNGEEIREAIKELKVVMKTAHPNFKWTIAILINSKINGIVEDFDTSVEKIEDKISLAEEEGYDTSNLEDLLGEYDTLVENARNNHQAAQDLYISAFNDGRNQDVAEEGRALQQDARENLREAKSVLKKIFQELRTLEASE